MLLGALTLLVVVAITHDRLPRDRSTWGHLIVAALVANAAPYLLFALAVLARAVPGGWQSLPVVRWPQAAAH